MCRVQPSAKYFQNLSLNHCIARVCCKSAVIGRQLCPSNSTQITDGCGVSASYLSDAQYRYHWWSAQYIISITLAQCGGLFKLKMKNSTKKLNMCWIWVFWCYYLLLCWPLTNGQQKNKQCRYKTPIIHCYLGEMKRCWHAVVSVQKWWPDFCIPAWQQPAVIHRRPQLFASSAL